MPSQLYAQVIVDIPTRALDSAFDYEVPDDLRQRALVGCCVLVDFSNRPSLGYIVGLRETLDKPEAVDKIKPLREVLTAPYFDSVSAELARWISREYLAPLSETIHLFTPPGSSPKLKKDESGIWQLERAGIGPVDDRWVGLTDLGRAFEPKANAVKQRAIIEALRIGEVRVAELGLEISHAAASLKALEKRGLIHIESRRRIRGERPPLPPSKDIVALTDGQREALAAILCSLSLNCVCKEGRVEGDFGREQDVAVFGAEDCLSREAASSAGEYSDILFASSVSRDLPSVILLDGVTGSGKTEVYLQAIRAVLEQGGSAVVLVPEIALTPQTVARFRARFGEQVAVLHSRLSAGERYDQWDFVRSGVARVVVGARSALFAPMQDLRLIVIDEEHEASYKQSSSPRYVTRAVATKMAELRGATLVLGSATPSIEALYAVQTGAYTAVSLPERASGKPLPPVQIVNLSSEFHNGNKTMFSAPLQKALLETIERGEKAVLLLNKRGFASFLLCRDCGFVPMCDNCATSMTYHERPARLMCHHCGATRPVPAKCPECDSPYLKQLGPGTQFAYDQLKAILPEDTPIIRMDADTTRGKNGHERCLDEFIAAPTGVLLGTQMIAKGLDFPEVTLVGVLIADTSLKFPDFRAPERTFQLIEQVAGRAGRAEKDGRVIVQTYWPEHVAIRAAAAHDRELLLADEREARAELGYPPYSRLANILLWGKDLKAVTAEAMKLASQLDVALAPPPTVDSGIQLLGPSPCVLAKRQGNHRWHILIKAPQDSDLPGLLAPVFKGRKASPGVSIAIDIDPVDLL